MPTDKAPAPERIVFGRVIRLWFKANGWAQDVPHRLAKFTGAKGPWNSQISTAMNAKLDPKPEFFLAFGAFNQLVAEGRFPMVSERRLANQLSGSRPLCREDGHPYGAADFFSLFTGLIQPPAEYAAPAVPEISDQEAKSRSEMARKGFQGHAQDLMLSPREAWDQVARFAENMNDAQLARFKEVLSGWSDWTGEELMAMQTSGSYSEPGAALDRWISSGGSWGVQELAREAKRAVEQR